MRTRSPISGEMSDPNCCSVVKNRLSLLSCLAPQAGGSCCPDVEFIREPSVGGDGVRPPFIAVLLCGEWLPLRPDTLLFEERGLEVAGGTGGTPVMVHVLGDWLLWKAELTLMSGLSGMAHSRKSRQRNNHFRSCIKSCKIPRKSWFFC